MPVNKFGDSEDAFTNIYFTSASISIGVTISQAWFTFLGRDARSGVTGDNDINNYRISNIGEPFTDSNVANKKYVDNASCVRHYGRSFKTGNLMMNIQNSPLLSLGCSNLMGD